jgi:hypothetical protein
MVKHLYELPVQRMPSSVLIHGMGSNSLIFYSKIKDLSENFRTYAVDTVGDKGLSICTTPIKKSMTCTMV